MPLKKKKKKLISKKAPQKRRLKKKVVKQKAKPVKKSRRLSKAKAAAKVKRIGTLVGTVTHYFPHVSAAVVKMKVPLAIGDNIKIKGHTTDFTQSVTSLQIDRTPIEQAKKGQEIGLLVNSRCRQHDLVYKI